MVTIRENHEINSFIAIYWSLRELYLLHKLSLLKPVIIYVSASHEAIFCLVW